MPLNLAKRWECCGIGGADPLVRAGRPRPAFGTTVSVPGVAQEADGGVVPRGDPLVLGSAPLACPLFHIAAGPGEFRILRSAQRYQSLAWRKRPTGASSPEGTPWSWGPPHWLAHYFTSPPGLANFASSDLHNGISPWRGARGRRGRRPQRGPPGPGVRPTGLHTISHRRRAWRISHPPICTTVSVPGVAQEADGGVVPRGDPLVLGSAPLACTLFHIAAGLGEFRIL